MLMIRGSNVGLNHRIELIDGLGYSRYGENIYAEVEISR